MIAQSRQAAMGEMTSMLAHQWRQPLNTISAVTGALSFELMMNNYEKELFSGEVEKIENLVKQLSRTIDDFSHFFKPDEEAVYSQLHLPIIKALDIMRISLESDGIEVVENYESEQKIMLYSNEMVQVILNIFKNAHDNFQEKMVENPQITITTEENRIMISDNGGGIEEDIINKIYEPYFTTKNALNGGGLGLYMAKAIVEKHHDGSINAYNKDQGVCFEIVFL